MAIDLKDKSVLVYDYGSYISVAERLSREDGFGAVYYHVPYVYNGYPDHRSIDIGRGVYNVIRVKEWASVINLVDIVVFCDAHEPALQEYFVSIGKKVFGSRYASELEHDRKKVKELLEEVGLPTNDYSIAEGIDELNEKLKTQTNVYVKSNLRGDMETWHHEDYDLSKDELTRMRNNLGAYQRKPIYIIENPVESIAEIGIDTMCINGQYLEESTTGIELKDTGYYGEIMSYKQLPRALRLVTDKLSEKFRELNYCGAYSNEVIVGKDLKGYLIDNTCRNPQPNTDLVLEMYSNYPEIVFLVANGIIPKVEYKYRCGIQLIIKSEIAKTEPCPIKVPDEYKNNVKIKNLTIDDNGTWYYTPLGIEMCEIGSVIGLGDTMRQALNMAKKISESIKGFDIKINTNCIDEAIKQIDNLKKAGINYLT